MPKSETLVLVKYAELQVLEDGHEALWFEAEDGRWFCMFLPVGKTFGADVQVQDA